MQWACGARKTRAKQKMDQRHSKGHCGQRKWTFQW